LPLARAESGSLAWWLTDTPLHLLWAGGEAVIVFFVLSGLVLTRSAMRPGFSWRSYYPQRIARLYLPVFGALVIGYALITLVDHSAGDLSLWIQSHPDSVWAGGAFRDITLILGTSALVTPLWSLQWEVLFSLLLPAYVLVAVKTRRVALPVGLLCLAVLAAAAHLDIISMLYLPVFALGSLLAVCWESIHARAARLSSQVWAITVAVALLAIVAGWSVPALRGGANAGITWPLLSAGCVVLVVAAGCWAPLVGWLTTPLIQWLGRISFSLYLVHEPIVIATNALLGVDLLWVSIPVGAAVSLVCAAVFYRFVERPAHLLARSIGRRSSGAHRAAVAVDPTVSDTAINS